MIQDLVFCKLQFALCSPTLTQIKINSIHMSHFVMCTFSVLFVAIVATLSYFQSFLVHSNCNPNAHNLTMLDRLLTILILRSLKFQKGI